MLRIYCTTYTGAMLHSYCTTCPGAMLHIYCTTCPGAMLHIYCTTCPGAVLHIYCTTCPGAMLHIYCTADPRTDPRTDLHVKTLHAFTRASGQSVWPDRDTSIWNNLTVSVSSASLRANQTVNR